jgi:hypothetical protein
VIREDWLVEDDRDWSHGSGPRVAGTAQALGLAHTRRRAGLAGLSGPGVDGLGQGWTR